jgi:hypothetical protein
MVQKTNKYIRINMNLTKFIYTSSLFCNPFGYITSLLFGAIALLVFYIQFDKNLFNLKDLLVGVTFLFIGVLGLLCCYIQHKNEFKTDDNLSGN